jgi:hypothetical protein
MMIYAVDGQNILVDLADGDKSTKTYIMNQLLLVIRNQLQAKKLFSTGKKGLHVVPFALFPYVEGLVLALVPSV